MFRFANEKDKEYFVNIKGEWARDMEFIYFLLVSSSKFPNLPPILQPTNECKEALKAYCQKRADSSNSQISVKKEEKER